MDKSRFNIRRSRNGRLNRARRDAEKLISLLEKFEGRTGGIADQDFWAAIRDLGQSISLCVSEANAYNNVMVGDGWPEEMEYSLPEATK